MEWHAHSGLIATMVEAPLELQERMNMSSLPPSHIKACSAEQIPSTSKTELDGSTSDEKETEDQTSSAEQGSSTEYTPK
jgi:hypothetical protein